MKRGVAEAVKLLLNERTPLWCQDYNAERSGDRGGGDLKLVKSNLTIFYIEKVFHYCLWKTFSLCSDFFERLLPRLFTLVRRNSYIRRRPCLLLHELQCG